MRRTRSRQRTRPIWLIHSLLAIVGCAGGMSCAQMAAVEAAKAAVDTAGAVAQAASGAIPDTVQKTVDVFVAQNRPNWGRPSHIFVSQDQYILLYPTPDSERRQGHIRAIVVNRT